MNASAQELIVRPRIGRLSTTAEWRRELSKLYRAMRRGAVSPSDGTRLAYVADIGAKLCKIEQELRELQTMNERLERIESVPVPTHAPPAHALAAPQQHGAEAAA